MNVPRWGRLVLLLVLVCPFLAAGGTPSIQAQTDPRPNIVLIVTDDLDARTIEEPPESGLFPNLEALRAGGADFSRYFVATSSCCPSRASILRGQYPHNHGVLRTEGPKGGFQTFHDLNRERSTLATWLKDAGYRTALFGKYLNGYPDGARSTFVPPGWDEWYAFVDGSGDGYYYDYTLNQNGKLVGYGSQPSDYSTDVLSAKAAGFVRGATDTSDPFFDYVALRAPHGPADPAPRHAEQLLATAPQPDSFDEDDVSDKPRYIREAPRLDNRQIDQIDQTYRRRVKSMRAVDDLVQKLVNTLRDTGELANTYIFFTSDNGYLLGEHRVPQGKATPYEEAIRVPLLVRGPDVRNSQIDRLTLNTDLAPTIAELAGATPRNSIDGRSLVPLLRGQQPAAWRQAVLVEIYGRDESDMRLPVPPLSGLRTADDRLYVEYRNQAAERELYHLDGDPFQEQNLLAAGRTDHEAEAASLAAWLKALRDCRGDGCRAAENAPPVGSG